ncbi:hypothetical protein [Spirochaeta isovalerica]|uniref:Response regulatory domain-containing protein n=1 Tax=Spirochaeta isovalerica TaxID=150 RepID=A0A841RAB8_9SPIO|nr:hypothetical protein [Spirochaeta isovalerica]MBB6479638.1 hypothetical protein [Spirochaeta isovalerica]
MKVIYIDDNKNNLALMGSVVRAMKPPVEFLGTDSVDSFLSYADDSDSLYIIDFTLDGILGDVLYEKLLDIHKCARVIITSAGYISDLKDIFLRFDHKPIAITDRFGAIDIIRKELVESDVQHK